MLKEGWLEAQTGTSAKGRQTRIYRLTAAGIRHLESEVFSFERMFAGFTRVLAAAKAVGGVDCHGSVASSPEIAAMTTYLSPSRNTLTSGPMN
jgi:predicted ArsR family transcriptional regulator